MTVQDIYRVIDDAAPFSQQESYDRAGLLVGAPEQTVRRVLLTLDITKPVIEEAALLHADLILAHHPVIWDPIRAISPEHPVWHLVQHGIAAICAHTNLDISPCGLNTYIGDMMENYIGMQPERKPLVQLSGGRTLGFVAALTEEWTAAALAVRLKNIFGCRDLRYFAGSQNIRTIAWCSGSGGDLIADAISAGAEALVTGDCKHSVWAEAHNRDFTLFDCGHFETEVPAVQLFVELLRESAPELELLISETGTRPFYSVV